MPSHDGPLGSTDLKRWRLTSGEDGYGRHVWSYSKSDSDNLGTVDEIAGAQVSREQTAEDKYWLGLATGAPALEPAQGNPLKAAQNGYEFYKQIQSPDGHWAGEYGGPHFLIGGMAITMYATKTPMPDEWRIEIARYLSNMQRKHGPKDSGWGLHIEGSSTCFGTALNYVALRLLGVSPDEPMMIKARNTLHALGGATHVPSWGKMWLSILNVYDWEGFNPVPPELWLLPEIIPVHPSKWWVHTRAVYIPLCYLYGKRYRAPEDALIRSLREELYAQPYSSIDWPSCRNLVAKADLYAPHTKVLDALFAVLGKYESYICPSFIRNAGLRKAYQLVVMEDENTSYQTIGPVSKALNMLCRFEAEGPTSEAFKLHKEKVRDFFWMSGDGMMMTGTNGSQLWDASFIGQALVESGLAEKPENQASVNHLLQWLDESQIREDPKWLKEAHRHRTKGAWPFSTREQGYTVSDCTAEGLKTVLYLQSLKFTPNLVSKERLCDAVDTLLTMQNGSGGVGSYELTRSMQLIEALNPAEVFGNIMIEYSYPECTTACLTALSLFSKFYPDYRRADIEHFRLGCIRYIHNEQRPDGSWFGSWAVCFTYATMFALESLSLAGESYSSSDRVKKACEFLLARQMEDGGWGESFKACETGKYVHHRQSQVVNTAWAVIALLTAKCPDHDAIKRGCQLIMLRQKSDGSWAQEAIEGIFNKSCAISYPNYKFAWTIWALGKAYKELKDIQW